MLFFFCSSGFAGFRHEDFLDFVWYSARVLALSGYSSRDLPEAIRVRSGLTLVEVDVVVGSNSDLLMSRVPRDVLNLL